MFAVIKTGGKQYKVAEGDQLVVEKLDAEAGKDVTFGEVLMVGNGSDITVGAPLVAGASVAAEVVEQRKGKKVITRKKRQRSTYRRTLGHRQHETVIEITGISTDGKKAAPKKKAAAKKADAPKADAKKADAPKTEAKAAAPKKAAAAKSTGSDDLTKIKGIGKVFAGKLNAEGINSYADLAGLSKARIEELEDTLGVGGKFDEWVAQAKDLA